MFFLSESEYHFESGGNCQFLPALMAYLAMCSILIPGFWYVYHRSSPISLGAPDERVLVWCVGTHSWEKHIFKTNVFIAR